MISDSTLARLRRLNEQSMRESGRIRRTANVEDGSGGVTQSHTITGPFPCRVAVSRLQRGEELIAGQLQGRVPWLVTFPAGTDVQLPDTINVNGAVVGDSFSGGRNFTVLAVYAPTTYETECSCLCIEI